MPRRPPDIPPDIPPASPDDPDQCADGAAAEADLWFLPGPVEDAPEAPPPGFRAFRSRMPGPCLPGPSVGAVPPPAALPDGATPQDGTVAAWARAEAGLAARMARTAARFGALDDRLRRGPAGWRHRLALIEVAELGWLAGDRVAPDRLALWLALRLSGAQADPMALARMGWAVRRLTGGPGPEPGPELGPELGPGLGPDAGDAAQDGAGIGADAGAGLARFLGRHPPAGGAGAAPAVAGDRSGAWTAVMRAASGLHPISRAALGYHLWHLTESGPDSDLDSDLDSGPASGPGPGSGPGHGPGVRPSARGDLVEAAVTAARIAAGDAPGEGPGHVAGAIFAPLAMGGAGGLRAGGAPADRLAAWLEGMEGALRCAMRHLDGIEAWTVRADAALARRSGRTPEALRGVLAEWPLVSAPMAERFTGASRAAVQRNLAWMQAQGLIREVTGQGRFRMWRAAV